MPLIIFHSGNPFAPHKDFKYPEKPKSNYPKDGEDRDAHFESWGSYNQALTLFLSHAHEFDREEDREKINQHIRLRQIEKWEAGIGESSVHKIFIIKDGTEIDLPFELKVKCQDMLKRESYKGDGVIDQQCTICNCRKVARLKESGEQQKTAEDHFRDAGLSEDEIKVIAQSNTSKAHKGERPSNPSTPPSFDLLPEQFQSYPGQREESGEQPTIATLSNGVKCEVKESGEQKEEVKPKHFLLEKMVRYRYVDWEEDSFTPWSPCTERDIEKIENDNSIDIVQFKP
jgi:hypothetical protein